MKRYGMLLAVASLLLVGTGCMSTLTGESYSRDEARRAQTVEFGMVEYVRPVMIEGTKSGVGPAAGAAVGGIAGSTVGHGKGSAAAAVVGAVAGGVAGGLAEEATTRKQGVEITVRMDNGRLISVVQEVSGSASFQPGDRVRVLTLGGTTRIAQ
jgi:outer membrane lipoprotein SlyB